MAQPFRTLSATTTIETAELRVGMFVHLDLGWMSHPFALSSFRIVDAGQIATIRALGLARVRWSPDKSLAARLVALVNRYDNLCHPAQQSCAMTPHEALSRLFAQGKHQYDATLLTSFVRMMGVYPPGSVVQLTDDRYALVDSVNSSRPLKPRVLVRDAHMPRDEALLLDLEREPSLGIRRSLPSSQLPREALDYQMPPLRVAWFFEASDAVEFDTQH